MKKYIYFNLLLVLSLCINCSNDDVSILTPKSIDFIYTDGTIILENDCVDPNDQYAILIDVNAIGYENQPTTVEYTINGSVNSTTFTNDEAKMIPVTLTPGTNIAELVNSGISSTIHITVQEDFVLVE